MDGLGTAITALIVLIGLLAFRKEISKLTDWICHFRRLEKTKDGYAMHGAEASPPLELNLLQEQKIIESIKTESATSSEESSTQDSTTIDGKKDVLKIQKEEWMHAYSDNDYPKAVRLLQEEINSPTDNTFDITWLRAFQGTLIFAEDTQKGVANFAKIAEQWPTKDESYTYWAAAHRKIGQYNQALEVLDRGLITVKEKAPLLDEKIAVFRSANNISEAIVFATTAIREFPNYENFYLQLADVYLGSSKPGSAVNILEAGLVINTRSESIRVKLAKVFSDNDAHAFAAFHYAELAGQFPKRQNYVTLLANAYLMLDHLDKAMIKYREADKLAEGKEGWILGNIGNLLTNRGLHSEAIEYLKRAIQLDPESDYAHKRLAESIAARDAEHKDVIELFEKMKNRNSFPLPENLRSE